MKHYITPEEHARQQRRRGRQALGLLVAVLVLVGFVTVLRAGVEAVGGKGLVWGCRHAMEMTTVIHGTLYFWALPWYSPDACRRRRTAPAKRNKAMGW